MNLLDLMVKVSVDDQASSAIQGISNSIKSGLGSAAKAGAAALTAGVAAAATGVTVLGKKALDSYASFEQLEGGIDKLFGTGGKNLEEYAASVGQTVDQASGKFEALNQAHDLVMQNAQRAFETAGMSANQYMENVSGFSAALTNALGGDTVKAAEQADVAMRAISDNVNTFGTDINSVAYAYQGFARGTYAMLDNLKLGYGGNREEMERLIADANEWGAANGRASDLSIESFSDVITAIQQIQEKQQIAGTTAREASQTIEGSINATKAAWANLLTELGKEDGDISSRIAELAESAGNVVDNVVPRISQIATGLSEALPMLIPKALELGGALATSIGDGLAQAVPNVLASFNEAIAGLAESFPMFGEFLNSDMFANLAASWQPFMDGIQRIGQVIMENVQPALQSFAETASAYILPALQSLGEAAGFFLQQLEPWVPHIMNVVNVIIMAVGVVVQVVASIINIIGTIMGAIMQFSTAVQSLPGMVMGAIQQVGSFFQGLYDTVSGAVQSMASAVGEKVGQVVQFFSELPGNIVSALAGLAGELFSVGSNIIQGLIDGIAGGIGGVVDTIVGGVQGAIETAKSMLGIASPSKVFEGIGGFTMEGFAIGIEADATKAVKAMEDASNAVYGAASGSVNFGLTATPSGAYSGSEGVTVVIENFVNNTQEDARSLATRIGEYTDMELKMRGIRKSTAGGLAV